MPLCQLQKMLSLSYRAPLREIPGHWHSPASGAKPPPQVQKALPQRPFPCQGLSWRSGRGLSPHSKHPYRDPREPSSRLPFAPAIRAPASPLRACANTEAHLNKLRRHNKSKGNEGLCLGAGESLEFNYIGKRLAAKAQQVPDVSSTDVQECAELGGRAGGTTLTPVPGTAPAPGSQETRHGLAEMAAGHSPLQGPCAAVPMWADGIVAVQRWQHLVPHGPCWGSLQSLPSAPFPAPCPLLSLWPPRATKSG